MARILNYLRKASIKKRLFLALLSTSILPVIFVGYFSNLKYEKSIDTKLSSYSSQLLTEVSRNIDKVIDNYETISENIMINEVVQKGMQNYDNIKDYQFYTYQLELTSVLEKEFFRYSNFADIQLRLKDGQVFFNLGFEIYDEKKIEEVLTETEASADNMQWTYVTTNRGGRILFCRWINSIENNDQKLGYMLIVVDEKVFANQVYKHVNLGEGSDIFIVDKVGKVISSLSNQIPKGEVYYDAQVSNQIIKNRRLLS